MAGVAGILVTDVNSNYFSFLFFIHCFALILSKYNNRENGRRTNWCDYFVLFLAAVTSSNRTEKFARLVWSRCYKILICKYHNSVHNSTATNGVQILGLRFTKKNTLEDNAKLLLTCFLSFCSVCSFQVCRNEAIHGFLESWISSQRGFLFWVRSFTWRPWTRVKFSMVLKSNSWGSNGLFLEAKALLTW